MSFRGLFILHTLGLWLVPLFVHAQLTVTANATAISEADTLEIYVQGVGLNLDPPDFSSIADNFEILSNRSSSQYRSVNGRVDAWTRWTLSAKPKRIGQLIVPALELAGHQSKPLAITVKPLDLATREAIDAMVFFEVAAAPKPVYVQAQLQIARSLYYADGVQLYGDMPLAPEIPNAIVQNIGETRSTSEIRNGRRYGVLEQRFAIFPERSGTITVPGVSVSGSVRLPAQFSGRRRTAIRIQSPAIEVVVLPIPASYPADAAWLPARQVELIEAWDSGTDIALGTPVQRSLIARAEGTVASIIPPLDPALPDAIRSYPDPPQLTDNPGPPGVTGTRVESMSLVAARPGIHQIPAVSITWFDTLNEVVREARVAARTINVSGALEGTRNGALTNELNGSGRSAGADTPPVAGAVQPTDPSQREPVSRTVGAWWWNLSLVVALIAALVAALIAALTGWSVTGMRLRRIRQSTETDTAVGPGNESRAFRALQRACDTGADARAIKSALAMWASSYCSRPPQQAVAELRTDHPQLGVVIDELNACLFSADGRLEPSLPDVCSAIQAIRGSSDTSRQASRLGPLYPDSAAES